MTQRTILFRGKRIDNGEWVEGMLAYFFDNPKNALIMPKCYFSTRDFGEEDAIGNPVIEDDMAVGGFINVDPATVGQFTGNEDTNGTMVWEGSTIENCDTKDLQEVYWNLNESAWYCRYIGQNRIVSLADSLGNLNTVIK